MADNKRFLDRVGVSYLWEAIKTLINYKADKTEVRQLQQHVDEIDVVSETVEVYGGSASTNI